jgi:hypothetical protein
MAEFAQFIAIGGADDAFTVDGRTLTFDLADVDTSRTVALMFKVAGSNGAELRMTITSVAAEGPSIKFTLDATFGRPRSWHESVPGSLFRESGNRLRVDASGGSVTVSDILVLYHAKTG